MARPVVSIIVCTYQRPAALLECLESIERTVDLPHEVVCVSVAGDDATADAIAPRLRSAGASHARTQGGGVATQELTARRSGNFVHLVQPTRGGLVQAMNMGFKAATGDFQMQINDDCVLMPHSIANAVRFMEAPAHVHTVGQCAFFHNSPVRRNVYAQIMVEGEWYYVCHVRGLCFANFGLARREMYERLNWFDERYFMYGADPDFSLKVWHEAKMSVLPCPGALVRHAELNDDRGAAERAAQSADNAKLFAKWGMG